MLKVILNFLRFFMFKRLNISLFLGIKVGYNNDNNKVIKIHFIDIYPLFESFYVIINQNPIQLESKFLSLFAEWLLWATTCLGETIMTSKPAWQSDRCEAKQTQWCVLVCPGWDCSVISPRPRLAMSARWEQVSPCGDCDGTWTGTELRDRDGPAYTLEPLGGLAATTTSFNDIPTCCRRLISYSF